MPEIATADDVDVDGEDARGYDDNNDDYEDATAYTDNDDYEETTAADDDDDYEDATGYDDDNDDYEDATADDMRMCNAEGCNGLAIMMAKSYPAHDLTLMMTRMIMAPLIILMTRMI